MTALRLDVPNDIPAARPAPIVIRRSLLTPKEAGVQLGCCADTVRTLIREGHLKAVRPPHQGLRVRPADLAEYVDSLEAL